MNALASLQWLPPRPVPLDEGGPSGVAFEPLAGLPPGVDRFRTVASRDPHGIAVSDGACRATWAQTEALARALAARMSAQVAPDRPIAALLRPDTAFPAVFAAALGAGRALVPVDLADPPERQAAILRETAPAALIVSESGVERSTDGAEGVPVLASLNDPALAADAATALWPAAPHAHDMAGIAFTSGSTGRPKGLAFSQAQFTSALSDYVDACHINASDVILGLASLSGAGCRDALAALFTGARLHLVDMKTAGIAPVMAALTAERPTILAFVPFVLRMLMEMEGAADAFSSLRILDLFGDRATAADIALFRRVLPRNCRIRVSLASTETTELFSWFIPEAELPPGPVPCGYPARNKLIALLDEDGGPAHPDSGGEVVVHGSGLALGRWQDGRLSPGPFLADPADPGRRIYHTGDVVRRQADGVYAFEGRRDRLVKIHGLRAEPAELEDALRLHPAVADAAVVLRRTGEDAAFAAFIAPRPDPSPTAQADIQELRAYLAASLPVHLLPVAIHQIQAIPRLPNYKPDYPRLEEWDAAMAQAAMAASMAAGGGPALRSGACTPAAAVETVWRRHFGDAAFEADLPFDESGADSLKILSVLFDIERDTGIAVPLDRIGVRMTPSSLAAIVADAALADGNEEAAEDRPVLHLLHPPEADAPWLVPLRARLAPWLRFAALPWPASAEDAAAMVASGSWPGLGNILAVGKEAAEVAIAAAALLPGHGQAAGVVLLCAVPDMPELPSGTACFSADELAADGGAHAAARIVRLSAEAQASA